MSDIPPKGKWIEFEFIEWKSKTKVYQVVTKADVYTGNRERLGVIKWFSKFRKYSFFPEAGTIFEKTCLTDICNFLDWLMEERKILKAKEKQ